MNWNPVEYNTGEDARYGMAGQPGMDQMQMHRGAGFTIPDNIRADIILKDQEGWEVEEIIEMGYPSDVVSQVLVESKVEGRNPAGPTPTMKFPQGKELAGAYPTSPSGDIAKSFENVAPQPRMPMPMQGVMNPRQKYDDAPDPMFAKTGQEPTLIQARGVGYPPYLPRPNRY